MDIFFNSKLIILHNNNQKEEKKKHNNIILEYIKFDSNVCVCVCVRVCVCVAPISLFFDYIVYAVVRSMEKKTIFIYFQMYWGLH